MFNVPNSITLFRIFLVIVFTVALCVDPPEAIGSSHIGALLAFWSFALGAFSDFLDGYIARKYNLVTSFGKLIDPLADKILVSAAFIYLSAAGVCPFWATIVIIFREFLVTGIRQLAAAKGVIIAADWCGKWKTAAQLAYCMICLGALAEIAATWSGIPGYLRYLLYGDSAVWLRGVLLGITIFLTLWSGAHYCRQARKFVA